MTTKAARYQKAYRDRRKVVRQQQIALVIEVLNGIADGSNGITCTTTTDLWGITFHWGGEQSAYEVFEARANALGFTLRTIFDELEQRAVKRYQAEVNAKHDLETLKERVDQLMDDVEMKEEVRDGKRYLNTYCSDATWTALNSIAALKGTTMDGMIKDYISSQLKQRKGARTMTTLTNTRQIAPRQRRAHRLAMTATWESEANEV